VITGILFGLAPALRASRPQLVPALKSAGGTGGAGAGWWDLRSALVVLQLAVSLLVLVSAGLCVRSLQKLQRLDPASEPSRIVLLSLDLGLNSYTPPQARNLHERLIEGARNLPGVEAASLVANAPLGGGAWTTPLKIIEGYQSGLNERLVIEFNLVTGDYFQTLGVPLLRGRDFSPADTANSPAVAIVNDAFVRRYWPEQDPVGRRIAPAGPNHDGNPVEVVGVVESKRTRRLTELPEPAVYFPAAQEPQLALASTLMVRTGLDPSATVTALRGLMKSLDANVPVFNVRTLAQQKDSSLALQRMAATLLGGFGVLALLLAALGIYGVLAYSVSRRTREIGVRMALGAQLADVLRLVLRQGLGLAGVGLALGLAGAFGATRLLRGFLYEVQPLDPLTFAAVVVLLTVVVLVACWLPARRASRVDPMVALRSE
jgi:predicted permease